MRSSFILIAAAASSIYCYVFAVETKTFEGGTYSIARPARAPADGYRLLVFLHGQGGRARQAVDFWGEDGPTNGYIVVGPESAGQTWASGGKDPELVYGLIEQVQAKYDIPPARTLVVGYSAGGSAAYFFFLKRPELVGAFCVVNGYVPQAVLPLLVSEKKVPILTLTGEFDGNLASVNAGTAALRRAGYTVHAGTVARAHHAYDRRRLNPTIVEWFDGVVQRDLAPAPLEE